MKKIFALITLLFAVVYQASAIPAYPHPVKYQLPDGSSVTVRVYGDEFFNYMLTSDGYQVTSLEDGYLYYYTAGVGTRGVQTMRVSEPSRRSPEERRYVSSLYSGVDQTYLSTGLALAAQRRASMPMNSGEFAPFSSQAKKSVATRALATKSLVILCQYKDIKFRETSTQAFFTNMLNQEGYSHNGAIGSARDYFRDNSFNTYNPTFNVTPIVTLSENMSFYGGNSGKSDGRPRQMIVEACQLVAKEHGIDFSQYDSDGDGTADDVFVFYAGYNEAEGGPANSIWPHRWYLNIGGSDDMSIKLNGVIIDGYACTSELRGASGTTNSGIGTFCHEFGHVLGLPDFYDTDGTGSGGYTVGLYNTCVMSSGGYNSGGNIPPYYTGIERNMVGWNQMKDIKDATENLTINPIHTKEGNDVWKIETSNPGEYFYLEARQKDKWDAPLKGQGLLIYQIDRSKNMVGGLSAEQRWKQTGINAFFNHPCARIIEAAGKTTSDEGHASIFYPGSSGTTFFLPGSYGFKTWNGDVLPIGLTGISQSNGTVSLRVVKELDLCTLQGLVKDADAKPISAIKISVVEIEESANNQMSNLRMVESPAPGVASRATNVVYSAMTDIQGKYEIPNLPYAKYNVIFEGDGFDSYMETIELTEKNYTLDVTLNRFVATLLAQMTWAQGKTAGYLDQSQSIWVASQWMGDDLKNVAGKSIGGISVETGSLTSYEARILINNQLKYTSKGSTSAGGLTIVYLPSQLDLQIPSNQTVRVEFKVESGTSSIAMDGGPAYDGGSRNQYSENGSKWESLVSKGFDANLKMALLYKKDTDIPDVPSVVSVPSQRTCTFQFSSTDGNITVWNLRYKAANGDWKEVNGIKSTSYVLTDLLPETTYDGELIAVFGDKKSEAKAFQFITTGLTAKFAAIGNVKSRYAVGESYDMSCVNVQDEVQSLEWRWNGSKLPSESITFGAAGKGRLDCVITYTNGNKETLSREIVVQ